MPFTFPWLINWSNEREINHYLNYPPESFWIRIIHSYYGQFTELHNFELLFLEGLWYVRSVELARFELIPYHHRDRCNFKLTQPSTICTLLFVDLRIVHGRYNFKRMEACNVWHVKNTSPILLDLECKRTVNVCLGKCYVT
jgi:hypothetical protein